MMLFICAPKLPIATNDNVMNTMNDLHQLRRPACVGF